MSDKKAPNYTKEQTESLVATYSGASSDEEREEVVQSQAMELGKTVRSIRQKLVRENVYVKPERKAKTGGKIETKADIVENIASALGVTSEQLQGLDKATKAALNLLRTAFVSKAAE